MIRKTVYLFFTLFILFCARVYSQTYCTPSYTNGCAQSAGAGQTNDVIGSFSTTLGITNITNNNSGCSSSCPGNQSIFPPSVGMFLTVARGQTFRVTVAGEPTSAAGTYQQGYAVWVDWNNNGNFTNAGELVYTSPVGFGPFTSNLITVPTSAACGPTRMRVRSQFSAAPTNPCANYTYGEVEDYTVYVVSNPETPLPISPDTSLCRGGSMFISATASTVGTIKWYSGINSTTPLGTGFTYQLVNVQNDMVLYVENTIANCESKRVPVHISVGFKRDSMFVEDTISFCIPDTQKIVANIQPDTVDLQSKVFNNLLTVACQRAIPDDYIGHPGSYHYLPITVAGVYPLNISPANMVLTEVGVRINHTKPKELDISLIAPNNSIIDLSSDNGSNTGTGYGTGATAGSYVYCVFKADPLLPLITSATGAAVTGSYRPEQAFTTLTGTNNGIWRLRVGDDTPATTGSVLGAYLKFRTIPADSSSAWTPVYNIFDSIFTPDSFTVRVNPLVDTTYYLTFHDVPGCISRDSIRMIVGTTPTLGFVSVPDSICLGQTINVTATGVDSSAWNPITNISIVNDSVVDITPISAGIINYQVIGYSPEGCRDTATYTPSVFAVPPQPTISASGPLTFCNGNSVTLTSSSGFSYLWSNGETTQSITVSTSGTFSVQITNIHGCISPPSANSVVTVNAGPGTPVITGAPLTFCAGSSVTLSAPNGFTYLWSSGQTTQNIVVYTTQNVTVTISDANGCNVISATVQVTSNPLPATPVITPSGSLTFCNGNSINLQGPPGLSYLWSTAETTQSISVSTSGSYTLVVTDANSCTSAVSLASNVLVNPIPPTPTITTQGGINSICQGQVLSLSSSFSPSYLWSNGQTSQNISISASGVFTVEVTDANGCTSLPSAPFNVVVNPLPATPSISASGATTFCNGSDVVLSAPVSDAYLWSNGATTQSITVSANGTFNVIVTDVNGCVSPVSSNEVVTVIQIPSVTINSNGPLNFCNGSSVTLSPNLTSNGYLWSPTGEITQSIDATTTGDYSVQIIDANGCISAPSNIISVNVFPTPPVPIINSTTPVICQGGFVTLSTDPASAYFWSNGASTPTITTNAVGIYSVFIIDNNNCTSPSSLPINLVVNPLPPTPVITPSASTSLCQGQTVDLSGPSGFGYLWTPSLSTNQTITVDSSGVFILQVLDANGCTSLASLPIVVNVHPLPEPAEIETFGISSFCDGGSIELFVNNINVTYLWSTGETTHNIIVDATGSFTIQVTDMFGCVSPTSQVFNVTEFPIPPAPVITTSGPTTFCEEESVTLISSFGATYLWSPTGDTSSTILVKDPGVYTVSIVDTYGCPSPVSDPMVVDVLPLPPKPLIVLSGPGTFCIGSSVNLISSETNGNRWNTGELTQSINVSTTGDFTVEFQGANGCFSPTSDTVHITVLATPPVPVISADGPLTFCQGGSVNLSVDLSQSYLWNSGDTTQTISVNSTGLITVDVIDVCDATHHLQANVNVLPRPIINYSTNDTLGCAPLNVTFFNTSSNYNSLIWDFGDGKSSTEISPKNSYEYSGEYTVTLFGQASNGCTNRLTKPIYIKSLQNPEAEFKMDPDDVRISKPEVKFTNYSSNDVLLWEWTFDTDDTLRIENPKYSFRDTGAYKIKLVVTNEIGCTDTAFQILNIAGDLIIYVPNAFSPNNDGINDLFLPKGTYIDPEKFNMKIFDRWGGLVFETNKINEGWNGDVGIEKSSFSSTYIWQLDITDMTGERHRLKGAVTLQN